MKLNNLAGAYRRLGQSAEAVVCCRRAFEIFRALGSRRGEALTLNNLGLVYLQEGDRSKAIECYEHALGLLRAEGASPHIVGQVLANLGTLHYRHARNENALSCWRQGLEGLHPDSPEHRRLARLVRGRELTVPEPPKGGGRGGA